jgi:outer membrane protein TolC
LKFHGASGSVGFTNGRTSTNNTFTLINPNYSSGLAFNVTQPLLQGWRTDNTRTSLQTQEIARQIADIGVRTSIENTIAQVRNAYWNLRGAVESIEIQRQSLAQATKFREDNETKVTIGTLAPLDVLSARNTEQTRRVGLAQAIATWQTTELVLKQLIVGGADDDAFKSTLNPTDKPDFTQVTPDIQGAITKALAQRTDLDTARKNIQSSEISLELTKEGTRPTLTASGGYSVRGVGGTQHSNSGGVTTITPGGYFDALSSILQFNVPTWNVNFNFTYPIGMVAAKATLARTKLSLDQQRVSLKLTELNVATAVTNAALTVTNSYSSLQASILSRQLAQDTATAEQSKFDVGLSTNFNVAQTLNDLNAALLAELNARLTYLKAIIEFERLQIVGG